MNRDDAALPARLSSLRRRFEQWRASKPTPSSRIPPALWTAAVGCAQQFGLFLTVRTLGLDYKVLKRRVKAVGSSSVVEQQPVTAPPAFVELVPPRGDSQPECVVELENRKGAKLRVVLRGSAFPDLLELVRRFGRDER